MAEPTHDAVSDERLREIIDGCDGVTPGPWKVYDGSSWRRIGTVGGRYDDCAVLYPNVASDGHPDMNAGRGQDTYANLNHIARCDPETIRYLAAAELTRRSVTSQASEGADAIPTIWPPLETGDEFSPTDFGGVAERMTFYANQEANLKAVMSNNFNIILAALNLAASPSKRVERLETAEGDNSDILKEVSSNFRADLDRIMADNHPPETGWLIELPGREGPAWWCLVETEDEGGWFTKDSVKALRFARKEDAQAYIDDIGWTEAVPTEHEWVDGRQALQGGRS